MRSSSILRSALRLMSVRLVLQQISLAAAVFLLYLLWLHVPDASVLDVAGSIVLVLIVITVAGCGESSIVLRLAGNTRTPARLLRGTLWLAVGVALWFAWSALLAHLRGNYDANDNLWAGYLNSRFPHQLRNVFTYQHILLWLRWMWGTLGWIGTAAIAAVVFALTTSVRPVKAVVRALRSITYWIAAVVGGILASWLTGFLMNWVPGHGLRIEFVSLLLRLTAAILLDGIVLCLVLAVLAACMRQLEEGEAVELPRSTPAGTPEESQPRTVDNP